MLCDLPIRQSNVVETGATGGLLEIWVHGRQSYRYLRSDRTIIP